MGSVCCVAAKDRNIPSGPAGSGALHSPVCYWSFRRDNRRSVSDEVEDSSNHNSGVDDNRGTLGLALGLPSERGSFPEGLATPALQKSENSEVGTSSMIRSPSALTYLFSLADVSLESHVRVKVKNIVDSPDIVSSALPKHTRSTSVCDLLSAHTQLLPPRSTPSRRARASLGQQVSDSKILGLKPPNNYYSTSEGRPSSVISTCSNDFATGSHHASSEVGWSMKASCVIVAQSQRERWSFDSEQLGSGRCRLSGCSSSRFSCSPPVDQQTCGNCSKLLTERSPIARLDLPIAAVLACGHVYHAECIESMTNETEKYDPTCPICTIGEKQVAKVSRKSLKADAALKAKNYKNRVVDSYVRSECDDLVFKKTGGKEVKMDPSSSTKGSTSKSLMKWHFSSISSKWNKPIAKDATSKKSFCQDISCSINSI